MSCRGHSNKILVPYSTMIEREFKNRTLKEILKFDKVLYLYDTKSDLLSVVKSCHFDERSVLKLHAIFKLPFHRCKYFIYGIEVVGNMADWTGIVV